MCFSVSCCTQALKYLVLIYPCIRFYVMLSKGSVLSRLLLVSWMIIMLASYTLLASQWDSGSLGITPTAYAQELGLSPYIHARQTWKDIAQQSRLWYSIVRCASIKAHFLSDITRYSRIQPWAMIEVFLLRFFRGNQTPSFSFQNDIMDAPCSSLDLALITHFAWRLVEVRYMEVPPIIWRPLGGVECMEFADLIMTVYVYLRCVFRWLPRNNAPLVHDRRYRRASNCRSSDQRGFIGPFQMNSYQRYWPSRVSVFNLSMERDRLRSKTLIAIVPPHCKVDMSRKR